MFFEAHVHVISHLLWQATVRLQMLANKHKKSLWNKSSVNIVIVYQRPADWVQCIKIIIYSEELWNSGIQNKNIWIPSIFYRRLPVPETVSVSEVNLSEKQVLEENFSYLILHQIGVYSLHNPASDRSVQIQWPQGPQWYVELSGSHI